MAKLKIYEYPDPVLKQKAAPVEKVDDGLRRLLDDMLETMYAAAGVGLAAPQVGVLKRVTPMMRKKARHRGRCFWLILKSSPVRKKKSVMRRAVCRCPTSMRK